MNGNKKINLLPDEVKQKYFKRYMVYATCMILALLLLVTGIQYGRCGIISWQTNSIKAKNARYDAEKEKIINLQTEIDEYKDFMSAYENNNYFPFARFMYDLEVSRPSNVYIISIDTDDRLINEGVQEEDEENKKDSKNDTKKEEKTAETEKAEDGKEQIEEIIPEIKYESDIVGKTLTVRGYSSKQEDISKFIYAISNLSYINNAVITGVEEHKMPDGLYYNIFEIKIEGGAMQ